MEPCQGPSLTGNPVSQPACGCATAASPASATASEAAWVPAAIPLLWFAVLLLALYRRRRARTLTLGLGPAPEAVPVGMRLVLSEGERRFFRALGRVFRRRPVRLEATARAARLEATASPVCGTT